MGQALTEAIVEELTTEGKPSRIVADAQQKNLYLRVLPSGRKTWQLRARIRGKWVVQSLGEWRPTKERAGHHKHEHLTVKQARLKAASALEKSSAPGALVTSKSTLTLYEWAMEWYRAEIEPKYRRPGQTKLYLERDLGELRNKPLRLVTRKDVHDLIVAKRHASPAAANRLLAILKQLFRNAVLCEVLAADPTSVLSRKTSGSKEPPRTYVLTDDEIRRAWAIPGEHGNVYRLLLASGQRVGEVLALADEPTNAKGDVWHIPQNKSGRSHKVPVTPMMRKIVDGGLAKKKRASAWTMWRSRMGDSEATQHDCRRTVATRMRELGIAVETIEALLNHAPPRLVRVYQQPNMDKPMRDALLAWQRKLRSIVAD